jgi:hypothetical protein
VQILEPPFWFIGTGLERVRTSVDLERGRVEEPSTQQSFEVGFIERMCGLVDLGGGSGSHGRAETMVEEGTTIK